LIIANIVGGLGNQMFQYAAAYALSRRFSQQLKLDTSTYSHRKYHNPEGFLLTKIFPIDTSEATLSDYLKTLGGTASLLKLKNRINIGAINSSYIREGELFTIDDRFVSLNNKSAYLQGWWQTESYFSEYSNEIRELYKFKAQSISKKALELAEIINNCESVSIHVRRGDYVSNPSYNRVYGTCSIAYYENSMSYVLEKKSSSKFFIFSDDPEWVKSVDAFAGCYVIDIPEGGEGSWNDMYLMSLCKNNVIANSSFSWWGAWLNKNQEKIVIAPEKWFADGRSNGSLLPIEWVKL
jgi:hypothetical protein